MGDFGKDAAALMHDVRLTCDHVLILRCDVFADDIAILKNGNCGTSWPGFHLR